MRIEFSQLALKDLEFWKRADKRVAFKIVDLIEEVCRTPFSGRGCPERLKYDLSGCWSRRINRKDRLVYQVDEINGVVLIVSVRGHY